MPSSQSWRGPLPAYSNAVALTNRILTIGMIPLLLAHLVAHTLQARSHPQGSRSPRPDLRVLHYRPYLTLATSDTSGA
jgi:hypothetical protein